MMAIWQRFNNVDSNSNHDYLPNRLYLLMAVGFVEVFQSGKFRVSTAYAPHATLSANAKTTIGAVD